MSAEHEHSLHAMTLAADLLPAGVAGIDAGMTLTKTVRAASQGMLLEVRETTRRERGSANGGLPAELVAGDGASRVGVTGGRLSDMAASADVVYVPEIEAAARGAIALLESERRLGDGVFVLALLGTGTAFAAVRDGEARHLGGTALGGGSFTGIARRIDPALSYERMIASAERGNRRNVDAMISDVYPEGLGRIGPELTAAHLARGGEGSIDDFLAGLLNLHAESIAQIAASRGLVAGIRRIVVAGGFAHNNGSFTDSLAGMAERFGVSVELAPAAGFAGAIGAALLAAER